MDKNKALFYIKTILAGLILFLLINFLGPIILKPYEEIIMSRADLSSFFNFGLLIVIPVALICGALTAFVFKMFLEKESFLNFSLITCLIGFCIDCYLKMGGIVGLLLGYRKYLLFVAVTFLIIYGVAALTIFFTLKLLNLLFKSKTVAE